MSSTGRVVPSFPCLRSRLAAAVVTLALLGALLAMLLALAADRPTEAQATSYIVVHAHNPEGVEIGSIDDGRWCDFGVEVLDGVSRIGAGAHDEETHNRPIPIPPGTHTITARFNGIALEEEVVLQAGETQVLTFVFPRTEIASSSFFTDGNISSVSPSRYIFAPANINFGDFAIWYNQRVNTSRVGWYYTAATQPPWESGHYTVGGTIPYECWGVEKREGFGHGVYVAIGLWSLEDLRFSSIPYDLLGTGVGGDENQPPVASFTYSPEEPLATEEITFDAAPSHDPDGEILSYDWDFDDGGTAAGEVVTHTYAEPGDYAATLTVTDNDGLTSSTQQTVAARGLVVEAWTSGRFVSGSEDWYASAGAPVHVQVLAGSQPVEGATVLLDGVPRGQTDADGRVDIVWALPDSPSEGPFAVTVEAEWRGVSAAGPVLLYEPERLSHQTVTLTQIEAVAYRLLLRMESLLTWIPEIPPVARIQRLPVFIHYWYLEVDSPATPTYEPQKDDILTVETYKLAVPAASPVWLIREEIRRGGLLIRSSTSWTESMAQYDEAVGNELLDALRTAAMIKATLHSPALLYVTAPDGSHAGYDPSTGELVFDFPIAISDPGDEPFHVFILNPIQGEYQLSVLGTGSGSYTLTVQALDSDGVGGPVSTFTASITEGQSHTYDTTVSDTGNITVGPEDDTAPLTAISLEPSAPDGSNGWYVSPVTATLTAEDDPGGFGVSSTEHRLDAGPWVPYTGPFTLSADGTDTVEARSADHAGNVEDPPVSATVQIDQTPPNVSVEIPAEDVAVQDGVTLAASASDATSGVADVRLYVREDDGGAGIDVGFENLPAIYNIGTGHWEYAFDSTALPDGYYVALAKAEDNASNEEWSEVRHFSIRNWAVLELLPASESNKAGRTMPVKFSLRIAAAVDPAQPFVYNEDLTIKIYEAGHPGDVLQISMYGDRARNYRIGDELYIMNFKTLKRPKDYTVDIWRNNTIDFLVGSFGFSTVK